MKIRSLLPRLLCVLAASLPALHGAIVFQDGFESGALNAPWQASTTNQGRVRVTTEFEPASGSSHLVLDDSVADVLASASESLLVLDLTARKNVVLTFKAKSLGNEANTPPVGSFTTTRNYDGVAISADGGVTWRTVQALDGVPLSWTTYYVALDSTVTLLAGSFGPNFRIRFSAFDNAPAPVDGIAIDDVVVTADLDQRMALEIPAAVAEGAGPYTGYLLLATPVTEPLAVTLSASPAGQITVPATVTVPAGANAATFPLTVVDDTVLNLNRNVTVSASAAGLTSTTAAVVVTENDIPTVTLTIPAQLAEGANPTNNASVALSIAPSAAFSVFLSSMPSGELTLPSTVTVAAGQTQAVFTVRATDDSKIDGDVSVTVTAISSIGTQPATAVVTALDNESTAVSLTLPATIQEGGTGTGTVTLAGTLPAALTVSLASGSTGTLTVPASVTIPAGQVSATFTLTAVENAVRDGSRTIAVQASAAGFTGAERTTIVRDNDAASYRFAALPPVVNISTPLSVTLTALDIEGNLINPFSGSVALSCVLPDGSSQPLTPGTATLSASGWTGTVSIPAVVAASLRLRATDAGGNFGDSTEFETLRMLSLATSDLLWDAPRSRLYASVPATAASPYANQVVAIDPLSLQVTASVTTSQDPGRLAITSDGSTLYVALNGNGSVARIDLATMSVVSTFAVGTDPSYGTLYVADFCTVAGSPNLLVISQYRKSVSPSHNGVAVYDNGVRRANKTQDHTGSNIIEPSADPSIFFGYNTESTEFGFRRLKLDQNGMTQLSVNTTLLSGFGLGMVSDGDTVFATSGIAVDGNQMKRLGAFATTGLVCPELKANRVFYLEPPTGSSGSFDKVTSYDPVTYQQIRRLTLPTAVAALGGLLRWGDNGLAFRTASAVYLLNSPLLVSSNPPADLSVTVQSGAPSASVGTPLVYAITVTNLGPNAASSTSVSVALSDGQTIQSVSSSTGAAVTSGSAITLAAGDVPTGGSVTLSVTVLPQSAGAITCSASASSMARDPVYGNNSAVKLVGVGFTSGPNTINQLRLAVNNIVFDDARNLFWVTTPSTVAAPLGRSLFSIDPSSGLMSDILPLGGYPAANCMSLSGNGRYLYIGLTDVAEVVRFDLQTAGFPSIRVPLGLNGWSQAGTAQDIEVLDGDGTSILVTTNGDESAVVIDGTTRRPTRTGIYTVNRIERTATPNVFVGYDNAISSYPLTRLLVSASGVAITQTNGSVVTGFSTDISGAGSRLLSSQGQLVDSGTLTLVSNLGVTGRPCVDGVYQRAFIVNGASLRAFDSTTGVAAGTLTLPTTSTGDWALRCVRWGVDGFAITASDKIYIARWSAGIPARADANFNGIADDWESYFFGRLVPGSDDADGDGIADSLEYLLGSSPNIANRSPIETSLTSTPSGSVLHLVFTRRKDSSAGYHFETSSDLVTWVAASAVVETVLGSEVVDGVEVERVDAAIPVAGSTRGFYARLVR